MATRVAILGSGSAVPDPERGNPSQAVLVDGQVLLFDCGERTTVNLVRAGINPLDLDYLFFTHLHWDHICDFGYLMLSTWNCGRRRELPIVGPAGTAAMVESCIHGVHRADVEFVREYIRALPAHVTDRPAESPAYSVEEIEAGWRVETDRWSVLAGAVEHHQRLGLPSVGFRVETGDGVIAITGDTAPCDGVVELARGADVLVHDCAFLDEIIAARGMWSHSGPTGAGEMAAAAGVKTLVLTHLGPYTSAQPAVDMAAPYYGGRRGPEIWDDIVAQARSRFSGEVVLAHDALVLDVGQSSTVS
jgi:ribonuclease Z